MIMLATAMIIVTTIATMIIVTMIIVTTIEIANNSYLSMYDHTELHVTFNLS